MAAYINYSWYNIPTGADANDFKSETLVNQGSSYNLIGRGQYTVDGTLAAGNYSAYSIKAIIPEIKAASIYLLAKLGADGTNSFDIATTEIWTGNAVSKASVNMGVSNFTTNGDYKIGTSVTLSGVKTSFSSSVATDSSDCLILSNSNTRLDFDGTDYDVANEGTIPAFAASNMSYSYKWYSASTTAGNASASVSTGSLFNIPSNYNSSTYINCIVTPYITPTTKTSYWSANVTASSTGWQQCITNGTLGIAVDNISGGEIGQPITATIRITKS